jgi:hypothetical protein
VRNAALLGTVVIVAILTGWLAAKKVAQAPQSEAIEPAHIESEERKLLIHLYFGDVQSRYLTAEQRVMARPADDALFARWLVEALILGPGKGGGRTLPVDAAVRAVFMLNDTAVVDFTADSFSRHPGGIGAELLSVYSVVNTLVLNIEAVRSVKLLIGGRESDVLTGHIDLLDAFPANMLWVR